MTDPQTLAEELAAVYSRLSWMFDLVDEQLTEATNALCNGDADLAGRVREQDVQVDALELKIDAACEQILAAHHPTGASLRQVIAAMRINADLERVGDQSKNIAKEVPHLGEPARWRSQTHIMDMADVVRMNLQEARTAFTRKDRLLARQVLAHDLQVDRAHATVVQTIVGLCRAHPEYPETLIRLVTVSKALERVADHAKNIARSVVYLAEGVDIRHQRSQHLIE